MLCTLLPIVQAEQAFYLVPVRIEGEESPSNIFMSIKEREISQKDKAKYKMSKTFSGSDKADNPSEAFAAEIIDTVYREDKSNYLNMNRELRISGKDREIVNTMNGYGMIKEILGYSDSVYFLNEYDALGLKFYETNIELSEYGKSKAEKYPVYQDLFFLVPIAETESGFCQRFDLTFDPIVQCLTSARQYARKNSVKADLKGLTKISYRAKFDDVKSAPEAVDFYMKIIRPTGDTLFFKDKALCKTDFDKETNGIWEVYGNFWNDLAGVPDVNDFQVTTEYERFLGHFSQDSRSRFQRSLQKWQPRHLKNYKHMSLGYREVYFAIDADPFYFVFYATMRNPDFLGHDTFQRDNSGYKRVNFSYYSGIELLFNSDEFRQELMEVYKQMKK